jgi:predicted kinase
MMMAKMLVLCGISGTGKTHARTTDPTLSSLPFVDIADVYKESDYKIDWEDATTELIRRARRLLAQNEVVVVEGYFLPRTPSRSMLIQDSRVGGYEIELRLFKAPIEVCIQRIMDQYERGEVTFKDAESRIGIAKRVWKKHRWQLQETDEED